MIGAAELAQQPCAVVDPLGNVSTVIEDDRGREIERRDPLGNVIQTTYDLLVFDARDRLVEVKTGGSSVARYGYDTQNLRVSMEEAGVVRRLLLDGVEEAGEYDGFSAVRTVRYDRDPAFVDSLLSQVGPPQNKLHAYSDALGSIYGLTDGFGMAQAKYG